MRFFLTWIVIKRLIIWRVTRADDLSYRARRLMSKQSPFAGRFEYAYWHTFRVGVMRRPWLAQVAIRHLVLRCPLGEPYGIRGCTRVIF